MVAWALHSMSRKHDLPWQRVINSRGTISLPAGTAYNRQKRLLKAEGVEFLQGDRVDWKRFGWDPDADAAEAPIIRRRSAGSKKAAPRKKQPPATRRAVKKKRSN